MPLPPLKEESESISEVGYVLKVKSWMNQEENFFKKQQH